MISLSQPLSSELSFLEKLYLEAFPPEERRPWPEVAAGDRPVLKAVHINGRTAGMISYWQFGGFAYVEHFAIDPSQRGGGVGSQVLAELRRLLDCPVVLEVEHPSPDNPMAARRIGFYRRNGFHVLDFDYIQPPYADGLPEVPLLLMSTDAGVCPETVSRTLHREVYGSED